MDDKLPSDEFVMPIDVPITINYYALILEVIVIPYTILLLKFSMEMLPELGRIFWRLHSAFHLQQIGLTTFAEIMDYRPVRVTNDKCLDKVW